MPSPIYSALVKTVSIYIGAEKGADCVNRQVAYAQATADNFSKDHYCQILTRVIGATSIWIGDKSKQAELKAKLEALAG